MATPTPGVEYIEVNGLPTHTAAWHPRDLDDFYSAADVDYNNIEVRGIHGALPRLGKLQQKVRELTLTVFDAVDSNGAPQTGGLTGLRANTDELKSVLSPVFGLVPFRHHLEDGVTVLSAQVQVIQPLDFKFDNRRIGRGVMSLLFPFGVVNSETEYTTSDASSSTTRTFAVANDGSAGQYASTWTLTGSATAVTLTNQTLSPNPALTVTADLSAGAVTIDTAALRASQGGSQVSAVPTGQQSWLPLAPGSNTIQVAPTGGAAAVDVSHFPPFA